MADASSSGFSIEYLENRRDVVPAVADWVWQEWGFSSPDRCAADLNDSRRGAIPSRFVAVRGNMPLGVVNLIACNLEPRCHLTPWLAGLFVHPRERLSGVGSALTRFCEREAAKQGFAQLYLYTERAEGFYRRLGWITIETMTWEGEPIAVMARDLTGIE
jgi:GNAT superfamily N-acetyltransferase